VKGRGREGRAEEGMEGEGRGADKPSRSGARKKEK